MADKRAILDGFASRFSEVAAASGGRLAVREVPFAAQLNLRTNPSDSRIGDAVHKALGFVLPRDPNTAASAGGRSALWLGPDEWLIVGGESEESLLTRVLNTALGESFGSVVDVSANRTVIELSGPAARDVLAHGCLVDIHPRVFGPGRCAQTLLAKAQVIIHQVNDAPTFHLYVRTSFAWYVAEWLLDAMTEYRGLMVPSLPGLMVPSLQGEAGEGVAR
jgi:sarcosine oxidase subunit gamma